MVRQLGEENRTLTDRLKQLEAPRTDSGGETERMNRYLLGELKRRRLGGERQAQRRLWWLW